MTLDSARLSVGFSFVGHTYSHLFAPILFVVALSLERQWGLTHGEAVTLVVLGNVLFGVTAPLAGWLGDRWSSTGMMALFFIGTGVGMMACGLASGPAMITVCLAVTGLFASIYHPVGIAWLVRNAVKRGTVLGLNGLFGAAGPAVAALSAGLLTEAFGWRSAFLVPGAVMIFTGVLFLLLLFKGLIEDSKEDRRTDPPASREDRVRAFLVLMVTMVCVGLIYQATQAGLPKVFSERLIGVNGEGILGASMAVAAVYLVASLLQVPAGYLADRYPLRTIYILTFLLQVPVLMLAAFLGGGMLMLVAVVMVSANLGALPAENALIARYTPVGWRGFVFGLKFILAFGLCGGLGVGMEGLLYDWSGGFSWLFTVLAALAAMGAVAGLLLPVERREEASDIAG